MRWKPFGLGSTWETQERTEDNIKYQLTLTGRDGVWNRFT